MDVRNGADEVAAGMDVRNGADEVAAGMEVRTAPKIPFLQDASWRAAYRPASLNSNWSTSMAFTEFRKLSPVIVVDEIEPCLPFWTDRLGFTKTAEVPEGPKLGFVILSRDGVEIMYQSRASAANDIPALAKRFADPSTAFFIEVGDVGTIETEMKGVEMVVPRRKTFYGMDEVGVREPAGHVVVFAQPVGAEK